MKVLVVDDDIVARMMLMHLVDSCGNHAILEAEDGADAWRQLEAGLRPDIVFCDLRMPHLSGLELLQRLRADAATAALPFVLVSAASDGATLDEAAALGASGYIVKPFRQEDVRGQFERLFPAKGEEVPPDEAPHEVARRLGIDGARLRLYLDGLARQLQAAMHEPPPGDEGMGARLNRLREGCKTLGLYGAAAALAKAAAAPQSAPQEVALALASASAAVARQAERAARG
ncbi:response regulator [Massilia arenae]|uniref:Response regulator n=1 Tax=Massilia arenae TaxID=2603288 RepID=A0A5C7G5K8_9BURK|nr:response regulator [Massilia arenae]TXG00103.1 response regulator [Massilia arenae]